MAGPPGETDDGATPIDPDEVDDLIPEHLTTRSELNQWEARNIAHAREWLAGRRSFDPLSDGDLAELHKQMFGATWKWAGQYRHTDPNVSPYGWTQVPVLVRELLANTKEQYRRNDKSPDALCDIAMRFHHQLVRIHPWPNGNGRHAREATDALLRAWGLPPFTWGGSDLATHGDVRQRYIAALRAADGQDYGPLREFLKR
jgi:Fic-DOC domain mobile mystery protein B